MASMPICSNGDVGAPLDTAVLHARLRPCTMMSLRCRMLSTETILFKRSVKPSLIAILLRCSAFTGTGDSARPASYTKCSGTLRGSARSYLRQQPEPRRTREGNTVTPYTSWIDESQSSVATLRRSRNCLVRRLALPKRRASSCGALARNSHTAVMGRSSPQIDFQKHQGACSRCATLDGGTYEKNRISVFEVPTGKARLGKRQYVVSLAVIHST